MNGFICPVCSGRQQYVFSAHMLSKYKADFLHCKSCGFLSVFDPHWLEEAYSSAIADADTGLVARNIQIAEKVSSLLFWGMAGRGSGRYLDSAGGYGMLTRLMRDYGFDFYWADKYCENIMARGFEYDAGEGGCLAVTAMEVLEHVTDPVAHVKETLACANAEVLIFSTELYEGSPPMPDEWWYYALPTGQHISFFQSRTLSRIADNLGLNFYSANGIHIFSTKKLNAWRLRLSTSHRFVSLATPLLRRFMKSKTMDDHHKILSSVSVS